MDFFTDFFSFFLAKHLRRLYLYRKLTTIISIFTQMIRFQIVGIKSEIQLMKNFWSAAAMITATVIWGFAFSAQSSGMRFIDPMLFTALRSFAGALALIPVILIFDLFSAGKISLWGSAQSASEKKELFLGGSLCGLVISAASICQQIGLKYTSAGKTGFLTALYIIIVPLMGIFFKKKISPHLWIAVFLALIGSYLLCGGISSIGKGELFVILCAFIYSIHILVIDRYAPTCDCIRLSCIQFLWAAPLAAAASFIFQEPCIPDAIQAALPFWLFCGIGSSAIAFTLQMISQKHLHPVTASLLMSLESVFALIGGCLFLHESLSLQELSGCLIIFLSLTLPAFFHEKKSLAKKAK